LVPALPQLGWECFFDEPVMLGFILLGRMVGQQARGRAAAAEQLLALQPQVARLIADPRRLLFWTR